MEVGEEGLEVTKGYTGRAGDVGESVRERTATTPVRDLPRTEWNKDGRNVLTEDGGVVSVTVDPKLAQ